ncbi:MAG TPA: amino acid adenylation domain-containing protein, partial [Herpetosiphonaceae bacterium]
AFKVLLYRDSHQADLAVGTPIAGRVRPELEALIGFFVNTLVLRTDLTGAPSFAELVARVRATCLDAYAHQDLPFEVVVDALQPERDLSRQPLFQVMFAFQNTPRTPIALQDLTLEPLRLDQQSAKFDLTLTLSETAHGLVGGLEYRTDLFESATVERLAMQFRTLLEAVVVDALQRIDRLPLLTEAERHQLLFEWTATAAPIPSAHNLPDLFAEQVASRPDAGAVFDAEQGLTYRQLDARANRLARHLHVLGVRPESRVGVCLPRSVDMVVALLAVLKAGGCYVPLDPAYPQARLHFMLSDAQVSVVLTQQALRDQVFATTAQLCCLDTLVLDDYPDAPPPVRVLPDNLAYVIYTSGSTGQPKGVLGTQRGVVNRVQWMWRAYPFASDERCCQKTAVSFLDSVWEIFGPLLHGVPLSVIDDEVVRDPALLVGTLAEQRITRLVLVPSLLRAILDAHPRLQEQLPQLTCWVSSGEALPPDVARRFAEQMPHATLLNLYGSSEVAADATCCEVRQLGEREPVLIGRPIANMAAYVLDRQLQPVPIGVPGEVYIAGVGLARGYHHRPDLTAETFVPHPFSQTSGARLYRTGDLARWRPDGQLEYLGRTDAQVKLRGFRIELGEVESALLEHPDVRETVALMREDRPAGVSPVQRIVAYIVPDAQHDRQTPTPSVLRAFLQARLPSYMVPSAFVVLDALPLTPSGKIDRRALPTPDLTIAADMAFIAPRTPLEELIAGVWAAVLGLERVGVHDTFFALGGHSLLATQVISRLRQVTGRDLPLRLLFEAPTIAQFVEYLGSSGMRAEVPLLPVPRDGRPLPLSFAQQRLWFLHQLEPGSTAYHLPTVVRLRGTLDVAALQ